MILVDANLLIYAYDETSPFHRTARGWLEETLNEQDEVAIALVSILAFLRIMTNPSIFEDPLPVDEAVEIANEWLDRPNVGVVQPTRRHLEVLDDVAGRGKIRGPRLMDAHLAALAIEHGATLYSSDRDFARFRGLKVVDPIGD